MRIPFNDSASLTSLTLKMQYADGYVAYLNGVEVASENAPASPTWNSLATAAQTNVQATTYEDVDLSSFLNANTTGHLTATGNVLAIQVLASSTSPTQMLVVPELAQMTSTIGGDFIFATPSPAAANPVSDVQAGISFNTAQDTAQDNSLPDGMYYAPISLALVPNVAGMPIYYTTDTTTPGYQAVSSITFSGTTATASTTYPVQFVTGDNVQIANATPAIYNGTFDDITVTGTNSFTYTLPSMPIANASGASITATDGKLYTGPISIRTTTVVQAAVVEERLCVTLPDPDLRLPLCGGQQSNATAEAAGFPASWIGALDSQATVSADYAMSSVPTYTTAQVATALASLPVMSMVSTDAQMFGPNGIYSNSQDKTYRR